MGICACRRSFITNEEDIAALEAGLKGLAHHRGQILILIRRDQIDSRLDSGFPPALHSGA